MASTLTGQVSQTSEDKNISAGARRLGQTVVVALFFMWGFITCLNDILIPHLKGVFRLNYSEAVLIQFTFFGAYFLMSLPAGKLVSNFGYKKTMVTGLVTAGVGTLLFVPAADWVSYPLFLGALFILATGITFLQVSANPYIAALGPPATASSRLNLAQAFNSLGTTLAPYLGGLIIFSSGAALVAGTSPATQAAAVKLPYLLLTAILVGLAIVITVTHLPRITAVEGEGGREGTFSDALKIPHLTLGAVGIFVYVGAEVSIGSFLINFLGDPKIAALSEATAAKYVSFYWGGAMVGRFIGSVLLRFVPPSRVLACNAIIAALLSSTGFLATGDLAMWAVLAVGFFNSIMFPNIFTLGIRDLGHLTARGSSLLIMAIVGGAIIPLLTGVVADQLGIRLSLVVPAVCYLYIFFYGWRGCRIHTPSELEPARDRAAEASV